MITGLQKLDDMITNLQQSIDTIKGFPSSSLHSSPSPCSSTTPCKLPNATNEIAKSCAVTPIGNNDNDSVEKLVCFWVAFPSNSPLPCLNQLGVQGSQFRFMQ